MTGALAKLRSQVAIARDLGQFVVLTPDEADAILHEVDVGYVKRPEQRPGWNTTLVTVMEPTRRDFWPAPHDGDDEHA